MPDLPTREYAHYAGIDPGFTGSVVVMNHKGTWVKAYKLPVRGGKGRKREFDLPELWAVFGELVTLPDCVVGIEWPTTRPGDGAERMERFGRGKGYLEAFAFARRLDYHKLSPMLWKGRLGLSGKSVDGMTARESNEIGAKLFETYYPDYADLIRGPRGGIKDGIMDAALIAHFIRTRTFGGMKSVVEQFGKGSPEAMAFVMGQGKKKQRRT